MGSSRRAARGLPATPVCTDPNRIVQQRLPSPRARSAHGSRAESAIAYPSLAGCMAGARARLFGRPSWMAALGRTTTGSTTKEVNVSGSSTEELHSAALNSIRLVLGWDVDLDDELSFGSRFDPYDRYRATVEEIIRAVAPVATPQSPQMKASDLRLGS